MSLHAMSASAPTRPVVRYHGGKWVLAPWIIRHFPAHKVYVDLFGGGGSVLMRKPRSYAEVYNDLDDEIVNVFQVLRDPEQAAQLIHSIRLTPFARRELDAAYLVVAGETPVERARRSIVRTFLGFGSNGMNGARKTGFRSNSNRSGTTPAHDWANYPDALRAVVERMRGVVIENRDWADVVRQHDSQHTLFYADPPYLHNTRTDAKRYRYEMTDADHTRLAAGLRAVRGMVVVSGYPSPLYDELYAGWQCVRKAAHADGALDRIECLWISPSAVINKNLF